MRLEIQNLRTRVTNATEEERAWVRGYLTFEDSRARFHGHGDGYVRLYNAMNDTFPSGFVPMIQKAAPSEGITVEIEDLRDPPCKRDANADLAWLRPYQLEAVEKVVSRKRGIIWSPTGSGKSEMANGLARCLPCRWLFLVHRSSLMDQMAERYELRLGKPCGRIGDGIWKPDDHFTVATFQTLYSKLGDAGVKSFLESIEGVIIDECHTLPSDSFWKVAMSLPNAYFRVGLSGTPLARGDRRSLLTVAATGPVIYRIHSETLINAGILARPKIRLIPVIQTSMRPTWQGVYGECIVRSQSRNKTVVGAAELAQKPCLVFVKEVSHGKTLVQMLKGKGISADFVWGSDSLEERKNAVKRLVRGEIDVLVCSVIFQEGLDIPALQSVVIASGGKSVIAALQRVGRGMRKAEGKDTFEVWDLDDRGNKWLERHARERKKAYESEGYEVTVEAR